MSLAGALHGASIRTKLSVGIALMSLVIVTLATGLLTAHHYRHVSGYLERKSALYAELLGRQLEPAVALDDHRLAREVLDALAVDPDVRSLALYDAHGKLIEGWGTVDATAPAEVAALTVTPDDSAIRAVAPVISREGPRGVLVVRVGTERLDAACRAAVRLSIVVDVVAMTLALLFAALVERHVSRRLARIAAAAGRVASGDLQQAPVSPGPPDEIGRLASAFNVMLTNLKSLIATIEDNAHEEQETLARRVKERTLELDARNADMRMILENVGEGFLTVDRDAQMSAERSAVLESWFGPAMPDDTFVDYVGRLDPSFATWFALGLEALFEDALPRELSLDQMPGRLTSEGTTWAVTYRCIPSEGPVQKLLVVISDLTAELARENAEAERRELAGVLEKAMRDPDGVVEFVRECDDIVRRVQSPTRQPADVLRDVHTLKGNCAIFGLARVASVCHDVETTARASGGVVFPTERSRVLTVWEAFRGRVEPFMKARSTRMITISQEEHTRFLRGLVRGRSKTQLLRAAADWAREPAEVRFARIADGVATTARRVGKPVPVVEIHGGVRLPRERWGPFWAAFVHVVSNALDHGIEPPEERFAAGKPERGHLTMSARAEDGRIEIALADDGRGIDWQRVRERAAAKGLPCATHDDLVEALFADGLSTHEKATEVSGRGVGMGALRSACTALGGEVVVESRAGRGTTVRVRLPRDDDAPAVSRPGEPSSVPSWRSDSLRSDSLRSDSLQ